jgi:hypothetical protein
MMTTTTTTVAVCNIFAVASKKGSLILRSLWQ